MAVPRLKPVTAWQIESFVSLADDPAEELETNTCKLREMTEPPSQLARSSKLPTGAEDIVTLICVTSPDKV